jgi:hypothetical protein
MARVAGRGCGTHSENDVKEPQSVKRKEKREEEKNHG